tara:strand:- start:235 stop:426 length:192 start_codon:yes stop_codon:yes gene_type:complete
MENLKDKLDSLAEDTHKILKAHKKSVYQIENSELAEYLEDQIALERIASLFTTAMYILDKRGK